MGVLLLVNGGFMLLSSLISLFSNDGFVEEITIKEDIVIFSTKPSLENKLINDDSNMKPPLTSNKTPIKKTTIL